MKKYWSLLLLVPFLFLFACMEDNSEYAIQEKEEVNVDGVDVDTTTVEEVLPDGELVPGVHLVKMKVWQGNDSVERQFKYYMPVSIDLSKPISLLFEFHGKDRFKKGQIIPNTISGISEVHALNQKAIKENCIVCFPLGWTEYNADSSGMVNWAGEDYTRSLPFVDALLKYFLEDNIPHVDAERVYATGFDDGATFAFELALNRPEVFAAIVPRAGEVPAIDVIPSRAVPVLMFASEKDDSVKISSILTGMEKWSEKLGGYFDVDMQTDTMAFVDYAKADISYWHGGKADYEVYSLTGLVTKIGHSISVKDCAEVMFDFLRAHTFDNASTNLFVTTSVKEVSVQCGEQVSFRVSHTDGAVLKIEGLPRGWTSEIDEGTITLTAPVDYFASGIDREGAITLNVTLGNQKPVSCQVAYNLVAPKSFFEVGDIYYDENFKPAGIVCWVNDENIREAKVITFAGPGNYGTIWWCGNGDGLGLEFDTPDRSNGDKNTMEMIEYNKTLEEPFKASAAAFLWAAELGDGWYLPAIEELAAIVPNLNKLNASLIAFGKTVLSGQIYSSTTEVPEGADRKTIYTYNFTNRAEVPTTARDAGSEYFGYISVRGMKKVNK